MVEESWSYREVDLIWRSGGVMLCCITVHKAGDWGNVIG
jgi:hypothetical protein